MHSFGREGALLDKYRTMCKSAMNLGLAQGRAKAFLEAAMSPIMFFMFGGCLWFGSHLVSSDMDENEVRMRHRLRMRSGPRP